MPKTPTKKISFQMPALQAYTILDWLGDAIKATASDDPALKAVSLLQSQLRSALRTEIGTPAVQKELFEPKPKPAKTNGKPVKLAPARPARIKR